MPRHIFAGISVEELKAQLVKTNECCRCHIVFRSARHKHYHLRHSRCSKSSNANALIVDGATCSSLASMQESAPMSTTHATGTFNVINSSILNSPITINQQITNISVLPHGKENIGYLSANEEEFANFIFDKVLSRHEKGLTEFVRLKYFHPDHPENHTMRVVRVTDSNESGVIEIWNGKVWKQKSPVEVIHNMMYDIGEDMRDVVIDGIQHAEPSLAKKRRKILNGVMTGIGSWIELDFSEIEPEGVPRWHQVRGEYFTTQKRSEMQREDDEKQLDFYKRLEASMHEFQKHRE